MALKVDIWGGNVECMRTDSWISSGAASGKVNASPEGGEIENSFLLGISPPLLTSGDQRLHLIVFILFDICHLFRWGWPKSAVALLQVFLLLHLHLLHLHLLHLHLHHPPQYWRLWPLDLEKYCGLDGHSLGYLHPSSFGIMRENATHLEKSPNVSGQGAHGM